MSPPTVEDEPAPAMSERAPSVSSRALRKTFGPVVAVDDVDLDIRDGELFSMLSAAGVPRARASRRAVPTGQ